MRVLRIDPAIQRRDGKVKRRPPQGPSPLRSHETCSRAMTSAGVFRPTRLYTKYTQSHHSREGFELYRLDRANGRHCQ
jgi:hypothetical protein